MGRGFIGGSDQHANAIYLHLRVLSSGIICRHSCLQAVTAQYAGEQFRLGAATNDCHTHRRAVHDLNSSVRTRICHKAAPGRYWVGGDRSSPCGGRHAFGPGPRRSGCRRQCRLSDEQQCRARVRHLRRLGRRRSLTQGPKCRPQLGGEEPRLLPGGEVVALVDLVRARGAPASSRYLLAGLDCSPPSAACPSEAQVLARPGRPASLRPPARWPVKGWPQAIDSVAGMPGTTVAQPRVRRR